MNGMLDIPIYSDEGGAARDIFFADSVDVLFYFEDSNQEFVYDQLLIKLGVRENFEVICTGGKTRFRAAQLEASSARKVFICDKDFDDITGEANEYLNYGFRYLGRFCFENYLLSVNALASLIVETARIQSRQVFLTLDLRDFINRLLPQYEKLGRVYAVARRHRITIPTTKISADALVSEDDDMPTDEYIQSVRKSLIGWCESNNHWILDEDILSAQESDAFDVPEKFKGVSDGSVTTHMCGKHLLRLVLLKVDKTFGTKLCQEDVALLYSRLVSHCTAEDLQPLKDRLIHG